MIINRKQLELGYAGLALLRNRLVGRKDIADKIANEMSTVFDTLREDGTDSIRETKEYSVLSGYKAWSDTYDSIPNLLIEVEEPVVKSLLRDFDRGKALDVACGTGRYSQILSSLGHDVIGVDRSSEMLSQASSQVAKVNFIQGDLNNLPIGDDNIDLAICALALTHLSSLDKAVMELNRVVCQGGYIVLSDIHPWFVIIGGQAEFQDIKGEKGYVFNHTHLHNKYLKIFNKLGLKVKMCLEPMLDLTHLHTTEIGLNLSKKTVDIALNGLPIVLVWVLEKT